MRRTVLLVTNIISRVDLRDFSNPATATLSGEGNNTESQGVDIKEGAAAVSRRFCDGEGRLRSCPVAVMYTVINNIAEINRIIAQ